MTGILCFVSSSRAVYTCSSPIQQASTGLACVNRNVNDRLGFVIAYGVSITSTPSTLVSRKQASTAVR